MASMDYVSVGVKTDKLDSIVTNVRDKDLSLMPQIYICLLHVSLINTCIRS